MPPPPTQPTFRNNPEVDAKIDAYIKDNPKYWAYVQAMPRERLERTVVLNEVRELDRQQRIREGVLKQINRNPELKRAYDLLVKDLPEDQKEGVIAQIARSAQARGCAFARPAANQRGGCRRLNRRQAPACDFPATKPGRIKKFNPQSCVPAEYQL